MDVSVCVCVCLDVCVKDTLRLSLVNGLVGLVDVLHGDGVGELVQHPLLKSLQALVVMATTHKLLILQHHTHKQNTQPLQC